MIPISIEAIDKRNWEEALSISLHESQVTLDNERHKHDKLVIYDIANTYRIEVEVLYGGAMENCNI